MKHICFIAEGYPTADDPVYTFVRQLVSSIADMGIKCSVIVPQSISKSFIRNKRERAFHWTDTSKRNFKIDIYQPRYISFSNLNIFGVSMTHFFWRQAVINTFEKLNLSPDVIYGHFWHSGIVGAMISEKHKLPVFVASGESKISVRELYSGNLLAKYLDKINGVICVSTKNKLESMELGLASQNKMTIIPNAIDSDIFYLKDKLETRQKLKLDKDDFIVAFTGGFIHRKGVLRLSEALKKVDNVKAIYIGSGEEMPTGKEILFCGKLPHDEIANYLSAADIFVLPTLAEGCCNAIIEAMACGLPIISSNLSFNDDILTEENSIRVDSNDVNKIADAIRYLKNHSEVREKMSIASLELAKDLEITNRAKRVIQYIEKNSGVK
jgi:teichuronic acid biosynthesis glycosyltransferase TuaC